MSDLLSIFSHLPLRKVGSSWRSHVCPSCGEGDRSNPRLAVNRQGSAWYCFSCGAGGGLVDAVMAIHRVDHDQAVRMLREGGFFPETASAPVTSTQAQTWAEETSPEAVKTVIAAIRQAKVRGGPRVMEYLTKTRGIPHEVLREAWEAGLLRFLPEDWREAANFLRGAVGEKILREGGFLRPEKKVPGIAFRPIVFLADTGEFAEFRRVPDGTNMPKAIRFGSGPGAFVLPAVGDLDMRLALTEGAIDALSLRALGFQGTIYGVPGTSNVVPARLIPDWAEKVITAFDNDEAGVKATRRVVEWGAAVERPVVVKSPPDGFKDINDYLVKNGAAVVKRPTNVVPLRRDAA